MNYNINHNVLTPQGAQHHPLGACHCPEAYRDAGGISTSLGHPLHPNPGR